MEAAPGLVIPGELSESGEDEPVAVATLQAWIPVPPTADPTRRSLLVFTFSTPNIQDWQVYCPVVVRMLHSLRFDPSEGGAGRPADPSEAPSEAVGDSSRISGAFG
jgi:hypothetical protein